MVDAQRHARSRVPANAQKRSRLDGVRGAEEPAAPLSDAQLITAIAFENVDALAEAYDRHGQMVYGLARQLCGQQRAEQITRRVFLALWSATEDFDTSDGRLLTRLITDVHQRSVAFLRAQVEREGAEGTEGTMPIAELERQVVLHTLAEDIDPGVFSRLEDAERQALILAYFGGYTYEQVAALLQQPRQAVAEDIRGGLRRLGLANWRSSMQRAPIRRDQGPNLLQKLAS